METLLGSFSAGFANAGHSVECLVSNDRLATQNEVVEGVHVCRTARLGELFSVSLSPGFPLRAIQSSADVWHVHQPNPLADLACLLKRNPCPIVITYHSDIVRQSMAMGVYGALLKRVLDKAWKIVVATPAHLENSPWLKAVSDKVECIPFGIDLSRFSPAKMDRPEVEKMRSSAKGRPIVLNVGRLVSYKGQSFLIESLEWTEAEVWIAGVGPLEKDLRQKAESCGVTDRVKFLGEISDAELISRFHACDVFALPSITKNEAFGIVQAEAMACGKPIVCCDLPSGVPYVNQDKITGLVVPPRDSEGFGRALDRILKDSELKCAMGEAANKRAKAEFDEPVMIDRYLDLFERARKA